MTEHHLTTCEWSMLTAICSLLMP